MTELSRGTCRLITVVTANIKFMALLLCPFATLCLNSLPHGGFLVFTSVLTVKLIKNFDNGDSQSSNNKNLSFVQLNFATQTLSFCRSKKCQNAKRKITATTQ